MTVWNRSAHVRFNIGGSVANFFCRFPFSGLRFSRPFLSAPKSLRQAPFQIQHAVHTQCLNSCLFTTGLEGVNLHPPRKDMQSVLEQFWMQSPIPVPSVQIRFYRSAHRHKLGLPSAIIAKHEVNGTMQSPIKSLLRKYLRLTILFFWAISLASFCVMTFADAKSYDRGFLEIDRIEVSVSTNLGRKRDNLLDEKFLREIDFLNEKTKIDVYAWIPGRALGQKDISHLGVHFFLFEKCEVQKDFCAVAVFPKAYWVGGDLSLAKCREVFLISDDNFDLKLEIIAKGLAAKLESCLLSAFPSSK